MKAIQDLINGNLSDALRAAKRVAFGRLADEYMKATGCSFTTATMAARYLKGKASFQQYCVTCFEQRCVTPEQRKPDLDDDATADRIGLAIAADLGLRANTAGRYNLTTGDKTPAGLARTLNRYLTEPLT